MKKTFITLNSTTEFELNLIKRFYIFDTIWKRSANKFKKKSIFFEFFFICFRSFWWVNLKNNFLKIKKYYFNTYTFWKITTTTLSNRLHIYVESNCYNQLWPRTTFKLNIKGAVSVVLIIFLVISSFNYFFPA